IVSRVRKDFKENPDRSGGDPGLVCRPSQGARARHHPAGTGVKRPWQPPRIEQQSGMPTALDRARTLVQFLPRRFLGTLVALAALLASGTVGYRLIEGDRWSLF